MPVKRTSLKNHKGFLNKYGNHSQAKHSETSIHSAHVCHLLPSTVHFLWAQKILHINNAKLYKTYHLPYQYCSNFGLTHGIPGTTASEEKLYNIFEKYSSSNPPTPVITAMDTTVHTKVPQCIDQVMNGGRVVGIREAPRMSVHA
jgi:hypothetical protein